jgi:hypothetical protein
MTKSLISRVKAIPFLVLVLFSKSLIAQTIVINEGSSSRYRWKAEWNDYISEAIDLHGNFMLLNDSLPLTEISKLCPNFTTLDNQKKKLFWILFIASIAKYESNFNPTARFKEPPPLNVYSEGLLQLSYGDEKRYEKLPIDTKLGNIMDPKVNLTSGVIILVKQLRVRKNLFTDKHYYWSVLTNKKAEISQFFQKHASLNSICSYELRNI